MRQKTLWLILVLLLPLQLLAQKTKFTGTLKDSDTGETLIQATVRLDNGSGAVTDFDGNFSMEIDNGSYTVTFSYVGYENVVKKINATGQPINIQISLKTSGALDEVQITADVARARETPVAFTNIKPAKIEEEIAGQDLPMVLNSTPGVHATQQGGGDGDARITIRGFNQRNVAVMIDGIPMNDMENGWVYWSNWFGLAAVTRSMQVQRGLGASKLALPSVGGTMNIITKGIETKRQFKLKQSVDDMGKVQTNFGFSSGKLKNGLGITIATAYKRGKGWVDATYSEGFFFYGKLDWRVGKHIVSLTGMGAPQKHEQRGYGRSIIKYDTTYAKEQGAPIEGDILDMGRGYNQHWGYLRRFRENNPQEEILNEKVNEYHKPQFSLRDAWTINPRLTFTNILYMSLGYGGGTSLNKTPSNYITDPDKRGYGQIDWQSIYLDNNYGGFAPSVINAYGKHLFNSKLYIKKKHNEHSWYGYLSRLNFTINENLTLSGGLDFRYYQGRHYDKIVDLLGGDYVIDKSNKRIDTDANPKDAMKYVGDKVRRNYDGFVKWGGAYSQLEFKNGSFSSFINLTAAYNSYQKKDYFKKEEEATSDWINKKSYTIKTGVNYNINSSSNVFFNVGYLSKAKEFNYLFKYGTVEELKNTDNELVKALEVGYSFNTSIFAANLNAYYTKWENKPLNSIRSKEFDPITGNQVNAEGIIDGMDALHKGVELDFVIKPFKWIEVQGLVSIGDWRWDKKANVDVYISEGPNAEMLIDSYQFDAKDIHVGDAAQTQYAASIRLEPFKRFYMKGQMTFFDRYYSDFTPDKTIKLDDDGNPMDSWEIPSYKLFDIHAGYSFKIDGVRLGLRFNILNVLDEVYISDARNNDKYIAEPYKENDAKSASVFFGSPRRYKASLQVTF